MCAHVHVCACVCVHEYMCLCEGAEGRPGRHGALEGALEGTQSMTQPRRHLGIGNCPL